MKAEESYISHLNGRYKNKETLKKYFDLLTRIHLISEEDFEFKEGMTLEGLKDECDNFIFNILHDKHIINKLRLPIDSRLEKRYKNNQISDNNKELFYITLQCLVAMSKAKREQTHDQSLIFSISDLGDLVYTHGFFTHKLKYGSALFRTQGNKLIRKLRIYFRFAPQEFHDVIYEIRKHISTPRRYNYIEKYGDHFLDLYHLQLKDLFEITLGLNIFDPDFGFFEDAKEIVRKDGTVIKGKYGFQYGLQRHHIFYGTGYLILIIDKETNTIQFELVPMDRKTHYSIPHEGVEAVDIADLINARMLHLYELVKRRESASLGDFRGRTAIIDGKEVYIWDGYEDELLEDWIDRWKDRNVLITKYYPNFFKYLYEPSMYDFKLYKNGVISKTPEFWWWYTTKYLGEEPLYNN